MLKSGFSIFAERHRSKIQTQNPDMSFWEVSDKVREMWEDLTPNQQLRYHKMVLAYVSLHTPKQDKVQEEHTK